VRGRERVEENERTVGELASACEVETLNLNERIKERMMNEERESARKSNREREREEKGRERKRNDKGERKRERKRYECDLSLDNTIRRKESE